ncbi:unnamed protein product [Cuscuta epithymum]|uniref:Uncharacterized protein n=1 Tax=Cuscuta epithymum TaxID=186058 RepID=A0AAV0CJV9_9ASTE|nr:unnamed protein product [Cuscuta epithymum]
MARQSNGRKKARSECIDSDQSDEDYMIDENECDESEDEYSSFIEDESEECVGTYTDVKKEKEAKRKKARNAVRQRASRTKKKRSVRPRKRKRVSYKEVDAEDDDNDDENDEDFKPNEVLGVHDEAELTITNGNKMLCRTRLHSVISKDDDTEYTPDDVDGTDAEEEEEEALPMTNKKSGKLRLRKCIPNMKEEEEEDDDDDDYDEAADEEFTIDEVDGAYDEEDVFPVIKSSKKLRKRRLHKGIAKSEEDDDSDEEFKPNEVDEVDGVYEEEEEFLFPSESETRLQRGISKGQEYDDDEYYSTLVEVDDFDEEEDGMSMMRRSRKLHRTCLDKGIAKGKQCNTTTSEVSMKITRGKRRSKCGVKKRGRVDEDVKLNSITSEKETDKITNEERSKKLIVHSDSDSRNSGPLDYVYSISEEEREQVREAGEFCGGLTSSWRCPVVPKDLLEQERAQLQKKRSRRKDKAKVEDWKTEAGKQVCGICLSEEGKRRVRGTLNCCNHYFCFACITEWSKVESRCPLCKQRFVTISKPAKSNTCLDSRTVVIQVSERDQVYQPSEEELRGYLDPYENVICTECQQGGDDALMLLCDLCDSSAHTYCVGLGHEVPEGNWYCEGCRPTTALDSLNQRNLNLPSESRTSSFSVRSPTPLHMPNVRESSFDLNEMYIPETPLNQEVFNVPSPRTAFPPSGTAATVSDRRRIQRQIHLILNDRMRQGGDNRTTGVPAGVTGNYLFGSQITGLAPQTHVSFLHGRRLQGSSIPVLSQSRNAFAEASSHFSMQPFQNQPSTSAHRPFSGLLLQGAVNLGIGSGLVHQQLHPCSSSRPDIVPDARTSPYQFREAAVPSMPWHGGYTHQFR